MKIHAPRMYRTGIALLMAVYAVLAVPSSTNAQTAGLAIGILTPAEGETLYAGPAVLQYSIKVAGWAKSQVFQPEQLEVRLQIFQGTATVTTLTTHPEVDGTYAFSLSVNPGANGGQSIFNPEHDICPTCHYPSDTALPPGASLLRVTVVDPAQTQAIAERRVIVDRSGQALVPIHLVDPSNPGRAIANVRVTGSTRLYLWRTRNASAFTDSTGQALVRVEALAQAPTQYVFFVEPTVVDGVLYQGTAPATITLAAGQTSAAQITLPVRSQMGQIDGSIAGAGTGSFPVPVRAVRSPDGKDYAAVVTAKGTFQFSDLPIGKYTITADHDRLAVAGISFVNQGIDLTTTPLVSVTLHLVPIEPGVTLNGTVHDVMGAPLPFVWAATDPAGVSTTAADSGAFTITNEPRGISTVVVTAPGYYSQIRVVDTSTPADFALTRRPETRVLPWGSGEVVVPPESQIAIEGQRISLAQGWLWGSGGDNDHPLEINLPEVSIQMQSGRFAIEYFSSRASWLYVREGTAAVRSDHTQSTTTVRAGEMLAITSAQPLVPAPLDPIAVAALRQGADSPPAPTWEPGVDAQIRDGLARMGIGAAQSAALVTYSFIVLALVGIPVLLAFGWLKRRREKASQK